MIATWPQEAIPFSLLQSSYNEQLEDNRYRFTSDSGRQISRRNTSKRLDILAGDLVVTWEQYQLFLDFYTHTLKDGTLPFYAIHPRTRRQTIFKFMDEPPSMVPYGIKVRITLSVQVSASTGQAGIWFLERAVVDPFGVWLGERPW